MSAETTVIPLATYRNETPYPFCPGCGHGPILDHLNRALVQLAVDPRKTVLVSDIGCSGLSDQYFATSAFHGLHGRSITYASGIKLARPELTVVVLIGDGGTGIGGTHLLNAARRNVGVTVVVFNNLNFGMTGGQHSTTTPPGALTSTTRTGNLERPLDLCATAAANGAGYVYRGTSFEPDLGERIAEAIASGGFALLDVWEPCTAYYARANRLTKKALYETMSGLGFATGVLARRQIPEYASAYRLAAAADIGEPVLPADPLEPAHRSSLARRFSLVVAGSAGERVRSAARLVARAGVLSGLWAAQRDDYPVTVQTGFSLSELILGPEPIDYAGAPRPDAVLLLSEDGRKRAAPLLAAMDGRGRVFALPGVAAVKSRAPVTVLDLAVAGERLRKTDLALIVLAAVVRELDLVPAAALEDAARREGPERAEDSLRAVTAGVDLGAAAAAVPPPAG